MRGLCFCLCALLCPVLTVHGCAQTHIVDESIVVWSTPRVLAGVPSERTLRWPSLISVDETLHIFANAFPIASEDPLDSPPMFARRVNGVDIPLPPGDFNFIYPKAIADHSDRIHLYWAEPSEPISTSLAWGRLNVTSLWHSRFDDGVWSRPQRVVSGETIYWEDGGNPIAVDGAGRLHLVVPVADVNGVVSLVFASLVEGETWRLTRLSVPAAYASLAVTGGDSLTAVYIGADLTVPSDENSVFVLSSSDGGAAWSAPRLIGRSGVRAAIRPRIMSRGGDLNVIWLESSAGQAASLDIRRLRSVDAGWTWASSDPVPLNGSPLGVTATFDGCGYIIAHVELFSSGVVQTHEISWWAQEPAVQRRLFPDFDMVGSISLTPINPSEMAMVFTGLRSAGEPPIAMLATRTSQCR